MHATVTMSLVDHSLAASALAEATPTYVGAKASEVLASAYAAPDGSMRVHAGVEDLAELAWALGECVKLASLGIPERESSDESLNRQRNERMAAIAVAFRRDLDDATEGYDRDETSDIHDDLVSCGREFPRNDVGEWLGRM